MVNLSNPTGLFIVIMKAAVFTVAAKGSFATAAGATDWRGFNPNYLQKYIQPLDD
jgi:hypothetical protein